MESTKAYAQTPRPPPSSPVLLACHIPELADVRLDLHAALLRGGR
ncbi:hypothetical protein WMF26_45440 [Sorangium sp. So ce185]